MMHIHHRRPIVRFVIALLLFMQMAVAAYACPNLAKIYEPFPVMSDAAVEMKGNCSQMLNPAHPNLCLQHCQQGSQATADASQPAPLLVDLPLRAMISAAELTRELVLPELLPEFLARTTVPPPSIRFGAFRS